MHPFHSSVIHLCVRAQIALTLLLVSSLFFHAESKPLTIAFNENWPPYSYIDENGQVKGILVEIIEDVIGKRMQVPLDIKAYPWARVQRNIEVGIQDGFVTTATEPRLKFAVRSEETVYAMKEKPFVNKTSPHFGTFEKLSLENIAALRKYRVCDMLSNGWAKTFYDKHNIEVKYFKDINVCFRNIDINRYDIAIHVDIAGLQQIKKEKLEDRVVMLPTVIDEIPFPLLLNKKSKYLHILPEFDKTIRAYREEGNIEKLVHKYIH